MGFDEWSTGKKIAVILVCIIILVAVIGTVAFFITKEVAKTTENVVNTINENVKDVNVTIDGNNSIGNVVTVAQGDYQIKIETDNPWTYYITTDGQYSQKDGSGSDTIDLGTVNSYSSISINQKGSGTMKVSIVDSNGTTVTEKTNSIDYGNISIFLKIQ